MARLTDASSILCARPPVRVGRVDLGHLSARRAPPPCRRATRQRCACKHAARHARTTSRLSRRTSKNPRNTLKRVSGMRGRHRHGVCRWQGSVSTGKDPQDPPPSGDFIKQSPGRLRGLPVRAGPRWSRAGRGCRRFDGWAAGARCAARDAALQQYRQTNAQKFSRSSLCAAEDCEHRGRRRTRVWTDDRRGRGHQ